MNYSLRRWSRFVLVGFLMTLLSLNFRETGFANTPYSQSATSQRVIANPVASIINPQEADEELAAFLSEHPAGRVNLMVELEGNPALLAGLDTDRTYVAADLITRLNQQIANLQMQADLSNTLQAMGVTILGTTQLVFNGMVIEADVSQIEAIRALPNVRAVFPDVVSPTDNVTTVQYIGSAQFWQNTGGQTGQGIRIGIIDTGIDYRHPNFGGIANYAGTDTTTLADGGFPSAKVVGGTDFAGDVFPNLVPDPDPMECVGGSGHGTHVAGTAAGFGVTTAGATYAGPYNTSISGNTFRIGPGVAPNASLYALKVGWCDAFVSNIATTQALEWAVTNGLHVVNLSLGASYGAAADMTSMAADAASVGGVVVVAAAGNSGDTFYIHDSPGVSSRAISVGGSREVEGVDMVTPTTTASFGALPATFGPHLNNTGPITATLIYVATPAFGCGVITPVATPWIALIDRGGTCNFVQKVQNAQTAGAVGVIVANSMTGVLGRMTGTTTTVTIPSVMVSNADGQTLAAQSGVATVTLRGTSGGETIFANTSRGPAIGINGAILLKPDLVAPGVGVVSSRAYGTGANQSLTLSGSSMSTPHVTGVIALLRQRYPGLSVAQLKALVMNTATNDIFTGFGGTGNRYPPSRVGAGRVDLLNVVAAFNNEVIAFNALNPEQVSVSFGVVEVVGATAVSRTITLQNLSNNDRSYAVSFDTLADLNGATITVSPASVTVPAGGTASVTVTLSANAAAMTQTNTPHPTLATTQVGQTRSFVAEESGYVELVPIQVPGPSLRVPVYSAPRPVSGMLVANNPLVIGNLNTGTMPLQLTGAGVNTGATYPTDVISLVAPFELVQESGDEPDAQAYENHADIQYIGITSDYQTVGSVNGSTLYFAISTWAEWSTLGGGSYLNGVFPNNTPAGNPFRFQGTPGDVSFEVQFDTNNDNVSDYALITWDLGDFQRTVNGTTDPNSDVFIAVLVNLNTGAINGINEGAVNVLPASNRATYPFNTNVLILPVDAVDLGLSDANAVVRYRVAGYSVPTGRVNEPAGYIDFAPATGFAPYNVADPVYSFTDANAIASGPFANSLTYEDLPGQIVPVDFDVTGLTDPLPCILLIHHHNARGFRPERVCVSRTGTTPQTNDLVISKVGALEAGGLGLPGESLTWVITLTNVTTQTFNNLTVTDTISPDLRVVNATTASGTAAVSGQTVTFTIPSLAPGQTIQMQIVTTVATSPASGVFVNDAIVTANGITRTAHAEVLAATGLPATGYPPAKTEQPRDWGLPLGIIAVGVVVLMLSRRVVRRLS
ncbi:MAG: S8 family serine peptidase [Anaerolineae bacterium]|nr:S8 family serine peptidase [Anaerolineae bacterium]